MERPGNVPHRSDAAARRPYRGRADDAPRIPVPPRKTLPDDFPSFVDPAREVFFITICCRGRHENHLAIPKVGFALLDTVRYRNEQHVWWATLAVVMPDHVHLLASFSQARPLQTVVSNWKEWTAKSLRLEWQRDFFEHRLRRDESSREKADYILKILSARIW